MKHAWHYAAAVAVITPVICTMAAPTGSADSLNMNQPMIGEEVERLQWLDSYITKDYLKGSPGMQPLTYKENVATTYLKNGDIEVIIKGMNPNWENEGGPYILTLFLEDKRKQWLPIRHAAIYSSSVAEKGTQTVIIPKEHFQFMTKPIVAHVSLTMLGINKGKRFERLVIDPAPAKPSEPEMHPQKPTPPQPSEPTSGLKESIVLPGTSPTPPTGQPTLKEIIHHLMRANIISGYPDGTYRESNKMERVHVATLLTRAIDLPQVKPAKTFKDVPPTYRGYEAIRTLQRAGVIDGTSSGHFRPTDSLTRAQMAKIMTEAFQLKDREPRPSFVDVPTNHWAKRYIDAMYANGITRGVSVSHFSPDGVVTRGQYAQFLYRALQVTDQLPDYPLRYTESQALELVERVAERFSHKTTLQKTGYDEATETYTFKHSEDMGTHYALIAFYEVDARTGQVKKQTWR